MKSKNLKKKKKNVASGVQKTKLKKQNNSPVQWKKVKLSGNLLSMDDGGAGLEGLLGLEVLENYDGAISITKEKRVKEKRKKLIEKNNDDSSDEDRSKCSKNERKKKKKKLKKSKTKKAEKEERKSTIKNPPGRFVRPIPDTSDDSSVNKISNNSTETEVKSNNSIEQSEENVSTTDNLMVKISLCKYIHTICIYCNNQ